MKQNLDQKQQCQILEDQIPKGEIKSLNEYSDIYRDFLTPSYQQFDENSFDEQLKQNRILNIHGAYQKFIYKIESELNDSQMVVLSIVIASFHLKLSLINIKGCNPLLKNMQSKTGNYGKVYYLSFLDQVTAFKVFPFTQEFHESHFVSKAIQQYSIMKICSILKCAPYLNNSCGFDLIVYNDSIMFSMEKCKPIQIIDQQTISQIKQNLINMHKHQIIHFDIKPDNIMFSPFYKKPIFIDFGFSSIVKEELGIKTFTSFKGSPAFCCKDMNNLLGETQTFDFIDVYYNDMHGLKHSLNHIKSQLQAQNEFQNSQELQNWLGLEQNQIETDLMVYLLKHKFFVNQREGMIKLLNAKDNLLIKKYGNQFLKVFKDSISIEIFEHIYINFQKQINKFIDADIIQNHFKYHYRESSFWNKKTEEKLHIRGESIFRNRIFVDIIEDTQVQHISRQAYKQFLQIQNVYCEPHYEEKSKQILIQSLRFDYKNNTLAEKIQFSKKFNLVFGKQPQNSISSVQDTFVILFDYCLKTPVTKWKKKYIFIILTQLIMLDFNFLSTHYQSFVAFLEEATQSFYQQVRCCLELHKLRCLMNFLNPFEYQRWIFFYDKLFQYGKHFLRQATLNNINSNNQQVKLVALTLMEYLNNKESNIGEKESSFYTMIKDFSFIKDPIFQNQLFQFLYFQTQNYTIGGSKYEQTYYQYYNFQKSSFIRSFLDPKRFVFHYSSYYIFKYLVLMMKYKQVCQLLENIVQSINCVEVCSIFKFQLTIFAFSDDASVENLYKFSSQLTKQKYILTSNYASEYTFIINKVIYNKIFCESYPEILIGIWSLWLNIDKPKQQILTIESMVVMFNKYIIAYNLMKISQIYPDTMIEYVKQTEKKLQSLDESSKEFAFYSFYAQTYRNLYLYYRKSYQPLDVNGRLYNYQTQYLQSLQRLYFYAYYIKYYTCQQYFFRRIIQATVKDSNQQKLCQYIDKFYNSLKQKKSFAQYFQTKQSYIIELTLYYFAKNDQLEQFYYFLIVLAEFITEFPHYQNYFHWFHNIQRLINKKKQRYKKVIKLMNFQILNTKINENYWKRQYFVLYYAYSIQNQQNYKDKLKIFLKIVQYISLLRIYAKDTILTIMLC